MKKENTASRLREIMETRNLRQVDILNMTRPYCQKYNVKMNKSDISQYCSRKTEPNQIRKWKMNLWKLQMNCLQDSQILLLQ